MDVHDERETWNRRYAEGSHAAPGPDPFLLTAYHRYMAPLFPQGGDALDVAGGRGRRAVWLAQRNWRVTLVDISEIGLEHARANAAERAVHIELVHSAMRCFQFGRERFDLVLVFYFLDREIFPAMLAALRPGGLLVYQTYTEEHRKFGGRPSGESYFLKPGELQAAFAGLQVLHSSESAEERGVAQLVARKPGDIWRPSA